MDFRRPVQRNKLGRHMISWRTSRLKCAQYSVVTSQLLDIYPSCQMRIGCLFVYIPRFVGTISFISPRLWAWRPRLTFKRLIASDESNRTTVKSISCFLESRWHTKLYLSLWVPMWRQLKQCFICRMCRNYAPDAGSSNYILASIQPLNERTKEINSGRHNLVLM